MNAKNLLVFSAVALATAVSCANAGQKTALSDEEKFYRHFGDDMKDVRRQKGKVVIVNCQKSAKPEWMKGAAAQIDKDIHIAVEVADGSFDVRKPVLQGEVSVFVVDDPELPMSLVAPEARWAAVNVATLKTDKEKFYEMRIRKAIARALAFVSGGVSSQFRMNVTVDIAKAADFDNCVNDRLPLDVIRRMTPCLANMGVTPWTMSNYRKACQEGWAPNPTNDVQKRIWDRVHELPSDPIKIKFDPKRDK